MRHLYESPDGLMHECEGGEAVPGEYLVWTKCEIDVPANKSFMGEESATCPKCLQGGSNEHDSRFKVNV